MRTELVEALVKLADDVPAARAALGLSPKQDDEIDRNAALWTSPTLPALQRYTGVLYDALDVALADPGPARAGRPAAGRRLGAVRAGRAPTTRSRPTGCPPARRCPACRRCARCGSRRSPPCSPRVDDLVVDLRSGSYAALAPVPGAVTLQVLSERPDGTRAVVSHFNKAHKGRRGPAAGHHDRPSRRTSCGCGGC